MVGAGGISSIATRNRGRADARIVVSLGDVCSRRVRLLEMVQVCGNGAGGKRSAGWPLASRNVAEKPGHFPADASCEWKCADRGWTATS